jgi:hypothetical protein
MPSSWRSSEFEIKKMAPRAGKLNRGALSYNLRGEHKHQQIGNVISSSFGWTSPPAPAAPLLDHLAAARAAQATRTSTLSKAN